MARPEVAAHLRAHLASGAVFSVGVRTAYACERQLGLASTGGALAGRAAALAPVIVSTRVASETRPLLFLAGDKAMPVLPALLAEAHVPLVQACVYETRPRPDLPAALAPYSADGPDAPAWVVLHSPSAVTAVGAQLAAWTAHGVRLAAIGATTAAALATAGLVATATAPEPTSAGVAVALRAAEAAAGASAPPV